MGSVYESREAQKRLSRLPEEVLKRYEKWKDIVQYSGVKGLRHIKGFHDETLRGERSGCRSSQLNLRYRVIYEVNEDVVSVYVINLTAHDYRR